MAVQKIDKFLENLSFIETTKELKALAKNELQYLKSELALSSVKSTLTDYRNAIKRVYGDDHKILNFLKLTNNEYKSIRAITSNTVNSKLKVALPFNVEAVVSKAIELVNSRTSYAKTAVGLALLTGRRCTEILYSASFEIIDMDNVMFTGQLKKKEGDSKPYAIPVLTDSTDILEALKFVQSRVDYSDLVERFENDVDLHAAISSRSAKTVNEQVKRHFTGILGNISAHKLRGLYAEICLDNQGDDFAGSYEPYFAQILGHSENDTTTAKHYRVGKITG